ncbi:F-box/LRR-repeat protein 6-like isoform X2 [Gigantopelta aegis]|nr:F-box/LRR-repeat protein 6-like isoform X2 [Gigantopelta aegis]XP_041370678.1 F-box/LRR-repeat protein 6-like isoform X2 [Gigantopelta aegis]XP_041370679.1 F-box/LRR-repeat protein 6-like isoform X2 [Gigantopelta aegis]XP_041370680.1 F-box/LRR-repeat protein 6-like isoform X2 [Gigantopelta aegis]
MPRKPERGILGYKKDPKNQILFSFNVRTGDEWPSDDSDDSDYVPDDGLYCVSDGQAMKHSVNAETKKKQLLIKNRKRKKNGSTATKYNETSASKKSKCTSQTESIVAEQHDNVPPLPPEIWLKIFGFVVDRIGALPFLCRAAKVCHMWHELSCHHSLWQKVDLSYGWIKARDQTLLWLCNNRLSQCRSINLTSWKNVTSSAIKQLAEKCPLLESVNLSYCKKLSSEAVTMLVDSCPHLAEIDVSFTSPDAVSPMCLGHLIGTMNSRLRLLNIAGNHFKAFGTLVTYLMTSCSNLEHLDISNANFSSDFVSLNIEKFQIGCKKLKVIRFANSKFRATIQRQQMEPHGFSDLEQLSLAVSTTTTTGSNVGLGIDDNFISRLLLTSTQLRLLDLRGCGNVTCEGLLHLPITNLQQLYISQSPIAKSNCYSDFEPMIQKWRHSLIELDLSWNSYPAEILHAALKALAIGCIKSPLESINLAGTSVKMKSVKYILQNCPSLNSINLTSCRGLPRGIKRDFSGKQFLQLQRDHKT